MVEESGVGAANRPSPTARSATIGLVMGAEEYYVKTANLSLTIAQLSATGRYTAGGYIVPLKNSRYTTASSAII